MVMRMATNTNTNTSYRTKAIQSLVTPEEFVALKDTAWRYRMSVSDLVRNVMMTWYKEVALQHVTQQASYEFNEELGAQ